MRALLLFGDARAHSELKEWFSVPIEGVEIEPFVLIQFANGQNRQVLCSAESTTRAA